MTAMPILMIIPDNRIDNIANNMEIWTNYNIIKYRGTQIDRSVCKDNEFRYVYLK